MTFLRLVVSSALIWLFLPPERFIEGYVCFGWLHFHRTVQSVPTIRIGLVARICRSQSLQDDQFRQGQGSIP